MSKILLSFFALIYSMGLFAQTSLPGDVPSPNASDLGRYGDIPISYHTGRPEIRIPLYDLTVRGVTLPVTLNHDASGVLLNSLPSWTGHNWTLDAGGCITRVVYGFYDDRVVDNMYPGYGNYFETYSALSSHLTASDSANNYSWLRNHENRLINDLAPDVFFFNFMGHSGRFFLGNDGEWKVACDENIEVIFDYTNENNFIRPFISVFPGGGNQPKTIKGFTLRDEHGTKYVFGGDTDHIEYTGYFFNMSVDETSHPWVANTWYLKRVEDRFGNTLFTLEYERGKFITHIFYQAVSSSYYASSSAFLLPSSGGGSYDNYQFPYNIQLIAPVYLKSIQALSGEKLIFNSIDWSVSPSTLYPSFYAQYGPNISNELRNYVTPNNPYHMAFYYLQTDDSTITPYQYNSTSREKLTDPLKTTCLRELYSITKRMASGNNNESTISFQYENTSKLHLTELIFRNGQMAIDHKYNFKYNNYNLIPADYLTTAIDHWGYYRGTSSLQTPTNFSDYYYSRNPVSGFTQYGLLTEIIYPTGGVTKLYYEQNDFSKYQSDDRLSMRDTTGVAYAGGVRIKKIEEYEDEESTTYLQRRIFTYTLPNSSTSSGQLFARPKYYWPNWRGKTISGSASSYLTQFCTSAILPLSNSFGSHIGYSYVTESFDDGKKIVYEYSNLSDARDQYMDPQFSWSCPTPYDVYSDRGYRRGKLLSVSTYDGTILKRKTEYTYRSDNVENNFVYSCNIGAQDYGGSPSTMFYTGGVYKLFYPKYDVINEKMTTYYGNLAIVDNKAFTKEDKVLNVSYGSYSHTVNIRVTNSETLTRGNDVAKTVYTYPFEYTTGIEPQLSSSQFYILPLIAENKFNNVTTYKKQTVYQNYNGKIVPHYEKEWKNGIDQETTLSYLGYTSTGAVSSYCEQGKPIVSLQWTNNDCLISRKTVGGSQTTQYTYTGFNKLSSVTMPNGNILHYSYDLMGRLMQITDANNKIIQKFDYNFKNK